MSNFFHEFSDGTVNSFIGNIPKSLTSEISKFAGVRLDEDMYWHVKSDKLKIPKKKKEDGEFVFIGEIEANLPFRYWNYLWALHISEGDHYVALKKVADFFKDGKPIYLPDYIGFNNYSEMMNKIRESARNNEKIS